MLLQCSVHNGPYITEHCLNNALHLILTAIKKQMIVISRLPDTILSSLSTAVASFHTTVQKYDTGELQFIQCMHAA